MKNRRTETELIHAGGQKDGQRGMTKRIVAFRNFANTSENYKFHKQNKNWKSMKILDQKWYKRETNTINLRY
jgi:hypothetical protein